MGGRQIRPARVFQTVNQELIHRTLPKQTVDTPPWFDVMRAVPPAETLVRPLAIRHRRPDPKATKPRNIYRPQSVHYLEDSLRSTFFQDHPWELARPRIIMELDGKDYQYCDWSKGLRQQGVPLTGESVVQRQMWLMTEQGLKRREAYDITRREFYRLRQEEEIESRIAVEEARHVGAYFSKTRIDVSHELENREFESWKVWAAKETEKKEADKNSAVDSFDVEGEDSVLEDGAPEAEGAVAKA